MAEVMLKVSGLREAKAEPSRAAHRCHSKGVPVVVLADYLQKTSVSSPRIKAHRHMGHEKLRNRQDDNSLANPEARVKTSESDGISGDVSWRSDRYDRGSPTTPRKLFDPKRDRIPLVVRSSLKKQTKPVTSAPAKTVNVPAAKMSSDREHDQRCLSGLEVVNMTDAAYQEWKDSATVHDKDVIRMRGNFRMENRSAMQPIKSRLVRSVKDDQSQTLQASIQNLENRLEHCEISCTSRRIKRRIKSRLKSSLIYQIKTRVELLELYFDLFEYTYGPTAGVAADSSEQLSDFLSRYWSIVIQPGFAHLEKFSSTVLSEDDTVQEWTDYFFVQCYGVTTGLLETVPDLRTRWIDTLGRLASLRCTQVIEDIKAFAVWQDVEEFWKEQIHSEI